jgi:hypothetical protein
MMVITAVGRVALSMLRARRRRREAPLAALTLQDGRVTTMDVLLDPARLARLDLTAFNLVDG